MIDIENKRHNSNEKWKAGREIKVVGAFYKVFASTFKVKSKWIHTLIIHQKSQIINNYKDLNKSLGFTYLEKYGKICKMV